MNAFLKAGVAALFGVVAWAGSAQALLTTPQTAVLNFSNLSGSTLTASFAGFNIGLGTLTEVILSYSAVTTINNTAAVINSNPNPQAAGSPNPLTATATITASMLFLSPNLTSTLTTTGFVGNVLPGPLNTVGTATSTLTNTGSVTNPILLSFFVGGPGTVGVNVQASGNQGGSVTADTLTGNNGSSNVTVNLQYRYNSNEVTTPEPASMVLVGAGLLGLGLARRRRA